MKIKNILTHKETKNASWLIGGRVAQMGISFFVGIVSARYLGPNNYGLISYGTAYVSFFAALCSLGLNAVIIKNFMDKPEEQGEAIGSALVLRIISSTMSVLMIIGIVSVVDRNEFLTITVTGLCAMGAIFHSFEVFNYWFQSQYKSKITAIATLIAYSVMSLYKIVLLIIEADVCWFALSTSMDYIVIAIFLYVAYKKNKGQALRFSVRKSKELLQTSYHYIWSSIMVSVYGQTDKFMIKQFLGEKEVGYYALAVSICMMWTFILQAIIDSMYPTILKNYKSNYEEYLKKNRLLYATVFYISIGVSVIFCIFGEILIKYLYGTDYLPATPILKIVTWYIAFSYLGVARNAWLVSEGKQKYLKYLYGFAAIMNVILNTLLIPINGASGAALASLITQLCTSIVLPLFFKELRPNAILMIEAILLRKIR